MNHDICFCAFIDCFSQNEDDASPNMGASRSCQKTNTIQECQMLCQNTNGCKRFVYVTDAYNGDYGIGARGSCCLKDQTLPDYRDVQDVVTGPAQCESGKSMHSPSQSQHSWYSLSCAPFTCDIKVDFPSLRKFVLVMRRSNCSAPIPLPPSRGSPEV